MEKTLYRKYRPENFSEVRAQDQVTSPLEGSIKQGAFSHAYLFSGSRGTGKTSVARIFAKEIGTESSDLYEIDAASNRGIDDVRELRESVRTLPYQSKYKVYIIDEVHMLTQAAFNALLKTLEEPPSHVVFILATTEIEKLPDTVVSRCEVHHFKKPSQTVLKKAVKDICEEEGYKIEADCDDLIALLGDGSFRDTLGVLQKVMGSVSGKKITREDVERVTGAPRGGLVNSFIESIAEGDVELGLKAIGEAVEANLDMKVFLSLVLRKVRAVILLRNAKSLESKIKEEFSEEDFEFINKLSQGKTIHSHVLERLLEAYQQVGHTYLSHVPLELALISLTEKEV